MNTQLNLFSTIDGEPTLASQTSAIKKTTPTTPNGAKTWRQYRDEYHAHLESCDYCEWRGYGHFCEIGSELFRLSSR